MDIPERLVLVECWDQMLRAKQKYSRGDREAAWFYFRAVMFNWQHRTPVSLNVLQCLWPSHLLPSPLGPTGVPAWQAWHREPGINTCPMSS